MLLRYRPPYDWGAMAAFLAARCVGGVEAWEGNSYRRVVYPGWVEMTFEPAQDGFRVSSADPAIAAQVAHLLDLDCDPDRVCEALGPWAAERPGLRVPGAFDGFEIATRAILGQQVSVAAARTLAGRFAAAFGESVNTPFAALSTAFPLPQRVAGCEPEALTKLGILPSRARTILALAGALTEGGLALRPGVDIPQTIAALQEIPGIGAWTAQYIAMRALAWRDAFPHTDLHVMRAMKERNPRRILQSAEAWRPWRAYAVMHLWNGGNPHVPR
jgi:AraC family transcriptional regulator of adaptative response / DNA-3-methyladenine glycosylase II